jgi:hypothetical protein
MKERGNYETIEKATRLYTKEIRVVKGGQGLTTSPVVKGGQVHPVLITSS